MLALLEACVEHVKYECCVGTANTRTKTTPLVEEIRPTCTKVHDLGTAVTVFLESRTFGTIVSIRDTWIALVRSLVLLEKVGSPGEPHMMHRPP